MWDWNLPANRIKAWDFLPHFLLRTYRSSYPHWVYWFNTSHQICLTRRVENSAILIKAFLIKQEKRLTLLPRPTQPFPQPEEPQKKFLWIRQYIYDVSQWWPKTQRKDKDIYKKKIIVIHLKNECHGNALRAHIRDGGHFVDHKYIYAINAVNYEPSVVYVRARRDT